MQLCYTSRPETEQNIQSSSSSSTLGNDEPKVLDLWTRIIIERDEAEAKALQPQSNNTEGDTPGKKTVSIFM